MTAVEIHAENSRRMRGFNREFSMALYNAAVAIPEPPLLLQQDGSESRYKLPRRKPSETRLVIRGSLIGPGPDRWGYHSVIDHDSHQVGDLWNDAFVGGVWARVEAPAPDGGWEPKWLRIM